jgi:homoserine O-acetyltransferase/O-succinyltransferase
MRSALPLLLLVCSVPIPATAREAEAGDFAARAAEHTLLIRDFQFQNGESLPELRQHYVTWGTPRRNAQGEITNAVLLLHGTLGTGVGWGRRYPGEGPHPLLGSGSPLDVERYFVIAPDTIGSGRSSKPSDGLRMKFPRFTLQDIVEAQTRVLDDLRVGRLVAVIGASMGGRQAWQWAVQYPERTQAVVPMIASPFPNTGRRGLIDTLTDVIIRRDPAFRNGAYEQNPEAAVRLASLFYSLFLTGLETWEERVPTREDAYKLADAGGGAFQDADATDLIYMMRLNDGFDAWSHLDRVRVPVLIINVAEDDMVPVGLGHARKTIERLADAEYIELSDPVHGHGGLSRAVSEWAPQLDQWLRAKTRLE